MTIFKPIGTPHRKNRSYRAICYPDGSVVVDLDRKHRVGNFRGIYVRDVFAKHALEAQETARRELDLDPV